MDFCVITLAYYVSYDTVLCIDLDGKFKISLNHGLETVRTRNERLQPDRLASPRWSTR